MVIYTSAHYFQISATSALTLFLLPLGVLISISLLLLGRIFNVQLKTECSLLMCINWVCLYSSQLFGQLVK